MNRFVCISYAEYVLVNDVSNLILVPDELQLDVAATLPCGALAAFAAVERVRPFITAKLEQTTDGNMAGSPLKRFTKYLLLAQCL